ncbi:hypothetical protein GCM10027589_11900 [Actinocorallia lasiicapitis]
MTDTLATDQNRAVLGPHSLMYRHANDARWALAVLRATVLEAAHPQIGAALVENSSFVAHPWRRMRNTLTSTMRILGDDEQARDREAARLNRMHARIAGSDENGRPYNAMDPAARAWVVATLFESTVALCRSSGESLDGPTMRRLYAEYRAFLAVLEGNADQLPPTLQDFWPYYDEMILNGLENTEAVQIILFRLFAHVPPPPLLRGSPPALWATGRAVAGPVATAIIVGSLPEPFRRQAGLADIPGAGSLSRGVHLGASLATRILPASWTSTSTVMGLLDPDQTAPDSGAFTALRRRTDRAGALFRLLTPDPSDPPADSPATHSADRFFAEVLDQTGDGHLDWPDLASMAREIAGRLDLDEPEETRLYEAYAAWWRELLTSLDSDGDGRITRQEYAAAASSLAGPALIRLSEVLFAAADRDGDGTISAPEHQALFRTAFSRDLTTHPAHDHYTRSDFTRHFLSFMSGRHPSTPYQNLFTQA